MNAFVALIIRHLKRSCSMKCMSIIFVCRQDRVLFVTHMAIKEDIKIKMDDNRSTRP